MRITVLSLFPNYFDNFVNNSIIKRAIDNKLVEFEVINFRDYTIDKHNNVDDTPYGGGAGMVLTCQPIVDCIKSIRTEDSLVIMMTPQGETFKQDKARELSNYNHLVILCGHYEGFDERIRSYVDLEISIGDYVLTGGEVGALVVSDAVIRLLDGVIKEDSHSDDSYENGLLEYPQYTKPFDYNGMLVPDVLLSGHHENIRKYRLKESLKRTLLKRSDLLESRKFSKEELSLLAELKEELKNEDR